MCNHSTLVFEHLHYNFLTKIESIKARRVFSRNYDEDREDGYYFSFKLKTLLRRLMQFSKQIICNLDNLIGHLFSGSPRRWSHWQRLVLHKTFLGFNWRIKGSSIRIIHIFELYDWKVEVKLKHIIKPLISMDRRSLYLFDSMLSDVWE